MIDNGKFKGIRMGIPLKSNEVKQEREEVIDRLTKFIAENLYEISFVSFMGGVKQLVSIRDFEVAVANATVPEIRHCVTYKMLPINDGGIYIRRRI